MVKRNTKKLPEFKEINEYTQAQEQQQERARQLQAEAKEGQVIVSKLKSDYEEVMQDAVINATDASDRLQEISEQIEKAEATAAHKTREAQVFRSIAGQMTDKQPYKDKFKAFTEAYQKEYYDPALERVQEAKQAYVQAVEEANRIRKHHENEAMGTATALGYRGVNHHVEVKGLKHPNKPEGEQIYLTPHEADKVYNGRLR